MFLISQIRWGGATRDEGESAGGKASAGLSMAPPGEGWKSSNIDFGGGSAAAKKAKKKSKERRRHNTGRQPPPAGADAVLQPLSGALTLAPLAQVFKDGGTQTPTADEVVLVFTPLVAQHLFGDPVGPGGQSCDGDNPRNRGDPGSEMRLDPLGAFLWWGGFPYVSGPLNAR
jgi:hypothetical protein